MDKFDYLDDFTGPEIIFNSKAVNPSQESTTSGGKKSRGVREDTIVERKKRKFTPEEYKEFEALYSRVVVNDYGDEYHMSEEERKRKFRYYEAFSKIARCKRKFRRLDEYVKVFRLCLDCLKLVASENGIYAPDKFVDLVMRGKIRVFGLNFPKYIGKDKKDINWKYISDFILDYSKDPSELTKKEESPLDNLSEEELDMTLFKPSELEKIKESITEDVNGDYTLRPYDPEDELDKERFALVAKKKETKKLFEYDSAILIGLRDRIKAERKSRISNGRLNSFLFELTEDDFEKIAKIDRSRDFLSETDIPKFTGDIMDGDDYKRYLYELQTYEDEQIKVNYKGKMRTQAEINEIELKDALEAAGWNVRNLYKNKDREKKLKKAYKKDKKREEELKKRLVQIQNRQKKRSGDKDKEIEFDSKKKKKKNKKKKKEAD